MPLDFSDLGPASAQAAPAKLDFSDLGPSDAPKSYIDQVKQDSATDKNAPVLVSGQDIAAKEAKKPWYARMLEGAKSGIKSAVNEVTEPLNLEPGIGAAARGAGDVVTTIGTGGQLGAKPFSKSQAAVENLGDPKAQADRAAYYNRQDEQLPTFRAAGESVPLAAVSGPALGIVGKAGSAAGRIAGTGAVSAGQDVIAQQANKGSVDPKQAAVAGVLGSAISGASEALPAIRKGLANAAGNRAVTQATNVSPEARVAAQTLNEMGGVNHDQEIGYLNDVANFKDKKAALAQQLQQDVSAAKEGSKAAVDSAYGDFKNVAQQANTIIPATSPNVAVNVHKILDNAAQDGRLKTVANDIQEVMDAPVLSSNTDKVKVPIMGSPAQPAQASGLLDATGQPLQTPEVAAAYKRMTEGQAANAAVDLRQKFDDMLAPYKSGNLTTEDKKIRDALLDYRKQINAEVYNGDGIQNPELKSSLINANKAAADRFNALSPVNKFISAPSENPQVRDVLASKIGTLGRTPNENVANRTGDAIDRLQTQANLPATGSNTIKQLRQVAPEAPAQQAPIDVLNQAAKFKAATPDEAVQGGHVPGTPRISRVIPSISDDPMTLLRSKAANIAKAQQTISGLYNDFGKKGLGEAVVNMSVDGTLPDAAVAKLSRLYSVSPMQLRTSLANLGLLEYGNASNKPQGSP